MDWGAWRDGLGIGTPCIGELGASWPQTHDWPGPCGPGQCEEVEMLSDGCS